MFRGGVLFVKDSRVSNRPLGRSLHSFARTAHSAHSLRSTPLCYTPFTGSLTHFAHSFVGQLKFLNMCSCCDRVSQEGTCFWRSLETRPKIIWELGFLPASDPLFTAIKETGLCLPKSFVYGFYDPFRTKTDTEAENLRCGEKMRAKEI